MTNESERIVRVLFQILKQGDILKMDAASNIAPTGGGARDLRFSPANEFMPLFRKMLPDSILETQGTEKMETYSGTFSWNAGGLEKSDKMRVWPPTKSRPNECRIGGIDIHNDLNFAVLWFIMPALSIKECWHEEA